LVPAQPLSVLSAMTQGQIGHLLVTAITGTGTGGATAVSVITHTVIDARDPAFGHPTKPVGPFLSEQQASAIRLLAEAGYVVIASGGGGIPVTRAGQGLEGAEAVIDKDLSAAQLASAVGASALMMLTDVDRVMLDFGTARQRPVDLMTADEAEHYLGEGQFPGQHGAQDHCRCALPPRRRPGRDRDFPRTGRRPARGNEDRPATRGRDRGGGLMAVNSWAGRRGLPAAAETPLRG
jgi:carbamate kinase